MADEREKENSKINVVVKTSKKKETIETESTATILEVFICHIGEEFAVLVAEINDLRSSSNNSYQPSSTRRCPSCV